jgi:rod shape determining protein RodA
MLVNGEKPDGYLLGLWITLMLIGAAMVISASTTIIGKDIQLKNFYLKQIVWVVFSFGMVMAFLRIPLRIFEVFVIPGYIFVLALLGLVLVLPAVKGAHRWIDLGWFRLQPSEFAKLFTILFAARLLSQPNLSDLKMFLRALACFVPPAVLVLLEPDLGTTLIFMATFLVMLSASGFPLFYMLLLVSPLISVICVISLPLFAVWIVALGVLLWRARFSWPVIVLVLAGNVFFWLMTPVLWEHLKSYQQSRVLTFLDPTRDPLGAGYQILQARIAIGSGAMFGKGFLHGTQKNLDFLPERHTDFIFSVIGEELGFIGALCVLLVFFLFLLRIAKSLGRLYVREHRIAVTGVLSFLAFQVIINVGMNMGMFPTTGIPLPFISYGGSNLLINSLSVGIILKCLMERTFM